MKKYLVSISLILLGTLLGAAGTFSYLAFDLEDHEARLRKVSSSIIWALEYQEAIDQAENPDNDIAIYALERGLRVVKSIEQPSLRGSLDCRFTSYRYAELHMKLAELYANKGEMNKQSEQFDHALAEFKKFGWAFKDADELQKAYALIESGKGKEAAKQYGSSTKSACYAD